MSDLLATRVVNIYHKTPYDHYIGRGRGSIWGNPFSHKEDTLASFKVETREEAVRKYGEWIQTQPELMAALPGLKGKVLACFCRPAKGFQGKLMCHGQVLAALCDGINPEDVE
jgi:hypothetical protein